MPDDRQGQGAEPRLSLAGPDPLDVLRALLRVDPAAPPVESAQGDEDGDQRPRQSD